MKFAPALLSLAVSTGLVMQNASAEELTGTLKKIEDDGTIVLANPDTTIPSSYAGLGHKPVGYS